MLCYLLEAQYFPCLGCYLESLLQGIMHSHPSSANHIPNFLGFMAASSKHQLSPNKSDTGVSRLTASSEFLQMSSRWKPTPFSVDKISFDVLRRSDSIQYVNFPSDRIEFLLSTFYFQQACILGIRERKSQMPPDH